MRAAKRCSVSLGAGASSMETSFTPPSLARTSRSRSRHPSARATSMLYAFSTRRICATAAAAAHTFVMRVRRGRATRGGNEQSSSSGQHGRRQHAQKQHTQQQQPPGLLRHRGHACSREASRDAERARRRVQAPRSRCRPSSCCSGRRAFFAHRSARAAAADVRLARRPAGTRPPRQSVLISCYPTIGSRDCWL